MSVVQSFTNLDIHIYITYMRHTVPVLYNTIKNIECSQSVYIKKKNPDMQ